MAKNRYIPKVTRVWEDYLHALYEMHCADMLHRNYQRLSRVVKTIPNITLVIILLSVLVSPEGIFSPLNVTIVGLLVWAASIYIDLEFQWSIKAWRERNRYKRLCKISTGLKNEYYKYHQNGEEAFSVDRYRLHYYMLADTIEDGLGDEPKAAVRERIWRRVLTEAGVDSNPPEGYVAG